MNDEARINNLKEKGVITQAEADRLLAAVRASAKQEVPHATVPTPTLAVAGSLGTVVISVEPGLRFPIAHGYKVEETPDGAKVSFSRGNLLDDVLSVDKVKRFQVDLPAGWAVDLKFGAGTVRINGAVAFVSGVLRAGDLHIEDTAGIDLSVAAGDVYIGLLAQTGDHQLHLAMGSAEIVFRPTTQASVDARVSLGAINARGVLPVTDGMGATARGKIGDIHHVDHARVSISVKTGDIRIRHEGNDPHGKR